MFVIAINHIDHKGNNQELSYVSWNLKTNSPSNECQFLIQERISEIKEKYEEILKINHIVPVCGFYNYGIDSLRKAIINY